MSLPAPGSQPPAMCYEATSSHYFQSYFCCLSPVFILGLAILAILAMGHATKRGVSGFVCSLFPVLLLPVTTFG